MMARVLARTLTLTLATAALVAAGTRPSAFGPLQHYVVDVRRPATPPTPLSPRFYSVFYETEISFGGEGGLYAECLPNRDFETLGRGVIPSSSSSSSAATSTSSIADDGDFRPWMATTTASVAMAVRNDSAPFASNPHSLQVRFAASTTGSGFRGLRNPGYWGIGLPAAGGHFRLSFWVSVDSAPAGALPSLTARLVDAAALNTVVARTVVPLNVTRGWARYEAVLNVAAPAPGRVAAAFEIGIEVADAVVLSFDHVSLFPGDAVAGLFRRDLFEAVRTLVAGGGFMRLPGGNYLEGTSLDTRWNWKRTLGWREARAGHYNSAWGYWVTDGLGLYELFVLARELAVPAQLSIYTGYSMGQPYVPLNESLGFAQDAVDAIEYCTGDADTTPWGRQRAADGSRAPFVLTRIEVGNEEADMTGYREHYNLITQHVWARYPNMTVVASGRWGPSIVGNPCLTGSRCDSWDDHYYRSADDMARLHDAYDTYDRAWPRVFIGEYAASGSGLLSLRCALAEAAFLLGAERNADVVDATSFAPLLQHVRGSSWFYDLVQFNATQYFTIPSYVVQLVLKAHLGAFVLPATSSPASASSASSRSADYTLFKVAASVTADGRTAFVKLVNYDAAAAAVNVTLHDFRVAAGSTVAVTVVTSPDGNPDAANSFEHPHAVAPVASTLVVPGASFVVPLAPWSLTILAVPVQ